LNIFLNTNLKKTEEPVKRNSSSDIKKGDKKNDFKKFLVDTAEKLKSKNKTKNIKKNKSADTDKKIKDVKHDSVLKKEINNLLEFIKTLDPALFKKLSAEFHKLMNNKTENKNVKLLDFAEKLKNIVENLLDNDKNSLNAVLHLKNNDNKTVEKNNNSDSNIKTEDVKPEDNVKLNKKIKVIDKRKHIQNAKNNSVKDSVSENKHKNASPMDKKIDFNNRFSNSQNIKDFKESVSVEKSHSLSKAEINKMIDHIVQKGKIILSEGKSEIMLKLKPESLGNMLLKLQIDDKGKLEGKIVVNNMMAEKVIKDNIAQLKVSFQNMGMEVGDFSVNVNESMNFSNQEREQRFSFDSRTFNNNLKSDLINPDFLVSNEYAVENHYLTDWLASNVNITV